MCRVRVQFRPSTFQTTLNVRQSLPSIINLSSAQQSSIHHSSPSSSSSFSSFAYTIPSNRHHQKLQHPSIFYPSGRQSCVQLEPLDLISSSTENLALLYWGFSLFTPLNIGSASGIRFACCKSFTARLRLLLLRDIIHTT